MQSGFLNAHSDTDKLAIFMSSFSRLLCLNKAIYKQDIVSLDTFKSDAVM